MLQFPREYLYLFIFITDVMSVNLWIVVLMDGSQLSSLIYRLIQSFTSYIISHSSPWIAHLQVNFIAIHPFIPMKYTQKIDDVPNMSQVSHLQFLLVTSPVYYHIYR